MMDRRYARVTGWLYFVLGLSGLFTDHLWHMFHVSGTVMFIHFAIGLVGLTVSRHGTLRACRIYSVAMGLLLLLWGGVGTMAPGWLDPYPLPLENALHVISGIWGFYGFGMSIFDRVRKATFSRTH